MPDTERKPAIRLRAPQRGQPITARFLGQLATGVEDALGGLDAAKSLKRRSTDNQINQINQGATEGTERILTAIDWQTATVRVYQNDDPTSNSWVDVLYYTQISFQGGEEVLTLVMPPNPNA